MVNHVAGLDLAFHALADPTRRAMLTRLGAGSASVSELARPHAMSLPAAMKHVGVLEESGWISCRKRGRTRVCEVRSEMFSTVDGWLAEQRHIWESRTDRLQRFVVQRHEDESQ